MNDFDFIAENNMAEADRREAEAEALALASFWEAVDAIIEAEEAQVMAELLADASYLASLG